MSKVLFKVSRIKKECAGCLFYCPSTKRFLLAYRSEMVPVSHTWACWGGAIDGQESPEMATRREVEEEAGFSGPMDLIKVGVSQSEEVTYTTFVALVDREFTPDLNWETEEYRWATLEELPSPLHPGLEENLPKIIKVIYQQVQHETNS